MQIGNLVEYDNKKAIIHQRNPIIAEINYIGTKLFEIVELDQLKLLEQLPKVEIKL